jgi:hypothetical protein
MSEKIIQVTLLRNELTLIKHMLPLWGKYVDGFVFMLDRNTDSTKNYLEQVREQYNVLEVLESNGGDDQLSVETNIRQQLFDAGRKYANHIICLDADEYLDGEYTKQDLKQILNNNPDTVFHLRWVQYTSINTIRVDGPWLDNFKDRIGTYTKACYYQYAQMHSTHLPIPENQLIINPEKLFIAHTQWVDKTFVAIKQYFWKVMDYVNSHMFGVQVAGNDAYDTSVNNFDWEEEYTYTLLKLNPFVFEESAIYNNYRLVFIKEQINKHNIPDLGSWGFDFLSMDETQPPTRNSYKVSVITAIGPLDIYEKFIPRYIKNVMDQHFFTQTEHIIVYSEWSNYFDELKELFNFKFIKEDERLGVYNAWNIGIQNATTDYVTNWNIDDLRHPINTKIKYDLLEKNHEYDLAYNWYVATNDEDEDFYNLDMTNRSYLRYPDNYHTRVIENCYAGPDPMWRKSLHDKVGYFDYKDFNTIGDWEMWVRFAKAGSQFKLIPEVLCLYLDHNQTVSQRQHNKTFEEKQRLYEKYR